MQMGNPFWDFVIFIVFQFPAIISDVVEQAISNC